MYGGYCEHDYGYDLLLTQVDDENITEDIENDFDQYELGGQGFLPDLPHDDQDGEEQEDHSDEEQEDQMYMVTMG